MIHLAVTLPGNCYSGPASHEVGASWRYEEGPWRHQVIRADNGKADETVYDFVSTRGMAERIAHSLNIGHWSTR